MRKKIIFIGPLTSNELHEVSEFLGTDCSTLGKWAKYTRTDSVFNFAVCSNGEHFIRLISSERPAYKMKEVKTYVDAYGYLQVSGFCVIHQLVANAFISDYLPYPQKEVNHLDGNKLNNDVSNLEMVTHQDNVNHFFNDYRMVTYRQSWIDKQRGRRWTDSQREKFKASCPHTPMSSQMKARMSQIHKGKHLSPEHIARLREVNKGRIPFSQGKLWINNGEHNKLILPEELSKWESLGYVRGELMNMPKHRGPYTHTAEFLEKQRLRKLSEESK